MTENPTPRQMAKDLLQGIAPPRPLFLPIVFSVGARIENVPLRTFLGNPTKIANAQRQIRSPLRSDGVMCYYDPHLEEEALGATVQWEADHQAPALRWPGGSEIGELPQDIRTPEEAVKSGRIGVAIDTIRRLTSMLRDGSLLMASVRGPFTLAARLIQLPPEDTSRREAFPDDALNLAASVITQISAALGEAGAHLIFIHEEILPRLSAESCEAWAALLAPILNVIRFFEALPVLLITDENCLANDTRLIFQRSWDCVVCPALEPATFQPFAANPGVRSSPLGIALPPNTFRADATAGTQIREALSGVVSDFRPALLTTAGDVPPATDLKHLLKALESVPRTY
jgi:uroporphyrinogen decarboxylase-like protein